MALSCFSMTMPPCTKRGPYRNDLSRSVQKNLTGLHRALTSTPFNTFGLNWNADCEPGLIAQNHSCSLMLLWVSESKSLQQCSNIQWKAFPEDWRLLQQQRGDQLHINGHKFGMRCPHTFGHVVYIMHTFFTKKGEYYKETQNKNFFDSTHFFSLPCPPKPDIEPTNLTVLQPTLTHLTVLQPTLTHLIELQSTHI